MKIRIYIIKLGIITALATFSCNNSKSLTNETTVIYNKKIMDSLCNNYGNNIAFISCLKCGCFVDYYNLEFKNKGITPTNYTLLADTNCVKLNFPITHIPNETLETMSDDFYNLVFVQRIDTNIKIKILVAEEVHSLTKIEQHFFNVKK